MKPILKSCHKASPYYAHQIATNVAAACISLRLTHQSNWSSIRVKIDSSIQNFQQTLIVQSLIHHTKFNKEADVVVYTPNVSANIKYFIEIDTSNIQSNWKLITEWKFDSSFHSGISSNRLYTLHRKWDLTNTQIPNYKLEKKITSLS